MKFWQRKLPIFILFLFLLLNAISTYATSFAPQAFSTTVQQAPVIIRGKIGMTYTDWGEDESGTRRIYTYYELEVTEPIKGQLNSSTLVFRELGELKME